MAQSHHLELFGGFQLTSADGDAIVIQRRKGAALLGYLGSVIGSASTRDKLASLLWGQSVQRLARQSLRQILSVLTQDLAGDSAGILCLDGQMVSLDPRHVQVDASEFVKLISQADGESLTKAVGLYKGEFLAGISTDAPDFEDWLHQSRSQYRDLALQGLVQLIEQQHLAGDLELAAKSASQALRIDPFREDIHRRLMGMYAERGMRAAALSQFRACEAVLRRELGVAPDDETVGLYNKILARGEASPTADIDGPIPLPEVAAARPDKAPLLVGFDRELALLRQYLRDSTQSGARLVVVAGEAGSGKTALLERFRWGMSQDDASIVMARARPAEQSMNFAFWKDILNQWAFKFQHDQNLSPQLARQLAFLREAPDTAARPRQTAPGRSWQVFDAMVELIRSSAGDAAVTLVMEDLHFADEASLQLLIYAVRNLRQSPVLFVATGRPELLKSRHFLSDILDDLDRDKLLHRIMIPALPRDQVEALVRLLRKENHIGMVTRAGQREIWTLSDGNPGVVVEAALSGDRKSAGGTPAGLPEGLYADLESRLHGLEETAKLLAATASVIGERIELALLARVADVDEETALRGVEMLIAAGMLASKDEALIFARGRFRLAQYRSLLPARRRKLHLAVAQAIEDQPIENPVKHFTSLAHHYNAAGRAADALRNGLRLAQIQMRQGGQTPAKRSFGVLLKSLPAGAAKSIAMQTEFEARLGLAEIEEAAGNFNAALNELSTPNIDNSELPDVAVRARYFAVLGRLNGALGNEEIGQGYIRRATGKWHADEGCLWQPSDRILEFIHVLGGNLQTASDRMVNARQTARRRGLVVDEMAMSAMISILQAARGGTGAAMAEAQAATDQAAQSKDSRLMAASLHVKGVAHTWCGDTSGALHAFGKAIELAVQTGDLPRLYSIYGFRGQAQATAGYYAEAIADFDTALSMGAKLDLVFSRALFQAWKAGALVEAGNRDSVIPAALAALKTATAANRPWAYSVGLRAMAYALARPDVGDLAGAERAIRMALSEQVALGIEFEREKSLVAYAGILHTAGEAQRSDEMTRKAGKLSRRKKMAMNPKAVRGLTTMPCRPCDVSSQSVQGGRAGGERLKPGPGGR